MIRLFFDVRRFFNVIIDLPLQFLCEIIFSGKFLKNFQVFAFFHILLANLADKHTNTIDVVSKSNTTDHFDHCQNNSLHVVGGIKVARSNSQHCCRGPVICPCVFLRPWSKANVFVVHPVFIFTRSSHGYEAESQDVGHRKIEEKNLDQRPVLFVVEVFDTKDFQFFNFFKSLPNF
jgi:hypothetical protein